MYERYTSVKFIQACTYLRIVLDSINFDVICHKANADIVIPIFVVVIVLVVMEIVRYD